MNDTDEEILQTFRNARTKERGFRMLVSSYQERLYWQIRRMVQEHEDADDVLQNVLIKVWKYLDNFKGDSQLHTWLFRIAYNESVTFLAQKKKKAVVALETEDYNLAETMVADEEVDGKIVQEKLQKAINQLPEKQKAVFMLRYYEEMGYEEMSKVLETSVGALKASYHHAVKKIESSIRGN